MLDEIGRGSGNKRTGSKCFYAESMRYSTVNSRDNLMVSAFPGRFIVETNGIILGYSPDLLDPLLPHDPYFRLTIKGDCAERFEEITGATGAAFRFQVEALSELRKRGGTCRIAAMVGAVDSRRLEQLFPEEQIEWEEFRNFGNAERNLAYRSVRLDRN
jgi:hypothetical protein